MLFHLTTIDQQGETRDFSLMGDLEVGYRLVDHILAKGDILLKATLVDGNRSSELPVESFYGSASLPALEALESEWKHLLSKPINSRSVCTQILPDLISGRIERHQACIRQFERAVTRAEQRLQHMIDTIHREPHRSRTLRQLEGTLKRHQQTLATERYSLQRLLKQVPH